MKILIVRVGAMGDVLHALPAVAALRRARPEWEIDWVVDPRWAALLEGGTDVRKVHLAETRLWKAKPFSLGTLRSLAGLRRAVRAERYDLVVDMQGTLRAAVIAWWAGAVTGFADPRESMAARFYKRSVDRRGTHVVEQNLALLSEACGLELLAADVALPRQEWAEDWAEREAVVRRPMAVLAPGGGWGAKQWPAERFGLLAGELSRMGFDVVVNKPRAEDALSEAVVEASGGVARTVLCNVAGLTALLRRTDLFVGGDSGPTHLAAALAVPLVALFGPTNPARNGPWGPGAKVVVRDASSVTSYKRSETVEAGLDRVSVETVVAAVREALD